MKGISDTLNEMGQNPELAEVNNMLDDHMESLKAPQSASQVEGFKIQVSFQHPSVPVRKFDWVAFYEGEEERREYGYGSTPYMAVLDLINNYSPTLYAEAQKYKR